MRFKVATTMLIVVALVFAVAGCGSDGSRANTIRVVYRSYSDFTAMGPLLTAVKTEFEAANPGMTVQLVPVTALDDDYQHKLQLMQRSAATAPDVFFEDSYYVNSDAAAGYLLPLDDYLGSWSDWHSQFIESTKQAGKSVDGKTYGVPLGTDSRGLWFNRNILARAGLPADWQPATWDDVLGAARKIKQVEPDVEPLYLPVGKPMAEGTSITLQMLLHGTETANLYNAATKRWVAPSRGMQDALNFVATAMREGLMQTAAQAEDTQWSRVERTRLIAQEKIAIVMDGSWYPSFWKPGGVSPWPNWSQTLGTAAFPTQHGQAPGKVNLSGGLTLALGARTAHAQAAFQFVTIAVNQKNSAAMALACSWLPVRKDVQADPRLSQADSSEPFWAGLLPLTHYRPTLADYPKVSDTMQTAGESVINGADPSRAAQQWADAVVRLVGSGETEAG